MTNTSIRYTEIILKQLWVNRLVGVYFNKSCSKQNAG